MYQTKRSARKVRNTDFENNHLDPIAWNYDVSFDENSNKYTIINTIYGKLDYFPKSNKLLIRRDNKWIWNGLNWIYKKLDIK